MTNPVQPLDPTGPPPAVTPHDTPSSPLYGMVTPRGQGPAPYDIQAAQPDLSGVMNAAGGITGIGIVYPRGPRQMQAETLFTSPAGFGSDGYDMDAGYSGNNDVNNGGWPNDVEPVVAGP